MHNIKMRLTSSIILLSTLLFFAGTFFNPTPVYAATTAEWINASTIRVTSDVEGVENGNYIDSNIGDTDSNYKTGGCDEIDLTGDSTGILTNKGANRNGVCDDSGPTINLTITGSPSDSGPARCFDSENLFEEIDCPSGQRSSGFCYVRSTGTRSQSGGETINWDGSKSCDEVLALQQQAEQEEEERVEQQADREGLAPECLDVRDGLNEWMDACPPLRGVTYVNGQCYEISSGSRDRGAARTVLCSAASATAGTEAPRREATDEAPPSCLNEGGDNSWLICPALNGLDGAISYLDNQVNSLLFVPEAYYNDDNQQLEAIWGSFRDLAYLLLIPTLLIMVIGTALGFQFLDAYTVKRALPRLFVAVIFIAISLPLLRFLVTSVNEIGQGVYGLISSVGSDDSEPFTLQGLFDPNPVQDTGASILFLAGGAVVIKFLLPFLFLLALAVLLQIAAIFILLAFRQFLIIALLAIAPLAILAWIFPGNDKPWKLWWGSLWKLLLIYPIIMALLAIGRVFAEIVQGAPGTQGLVEVIIKLVAYIGPFFLIPTAFKYAGGVFANIAGMVNDKERGPLDRLRKARQKSISNSWGRTKDGNLYQGGNETNLRGRINRGVQGAAMIGTGKAGVNPLKMRRELRRSVRSSAREEQQALIKDNADVNAAMVDDNLARAVLEGGSEQETRNMLAATGRYSPGRELEDAVSTVRRAQAAGSSKAVNGAMAVGLAASKTGYDSHADMYRTVIDAAGGDEAMERSLLADVKKASEGARPEFAANGYTDSWNAMQEVKAIDGMDPALRPARTRDLNARMRRDSLRKTGAHAMLAGKPSQTVALEMTELGTAFDTAKDSGNIEEMTEIASEITAYRGAMGSASPEARQHVAMMLDHVGVDTSRINTDTGSSVSTDEQLGEIIGTMAADSVSVTDAKARRDIRRQATQEIRTRAGLYDAGGGDRTPAELRGMTPPDET